MTRHLLRCFASALLPALVLASIVPIAGAASAVNIYQEPGSKPDIGAGPAAATSGVCTLESGTRSPTVSAGFDNDPWTSVATHLNIVRCTACPVPTNLLLNDVSFRVRWLQAGSEAVEVSVVGADIGDTGQGVCLAPDPYTVLCSPVSYTVSSQRAGSVFYTLAMPGGCCISGDAYVLLRFSNLTPATANPFLGVTTTACVGCEQYITTQTEFPIFRDICTQLPNPIWVAVGADCCQPTPNLERSWGTLKIRYR